jgi:hypothetical protein
LPLNGGHLRRQHQSLRCAARLLCVSVGNEGPAAARMAAGTRRPNALAFSRVAPSFTLAATRPFPQQALSAAWDQAINQILYDGTPHEREIPLASPAASGITGQVIAVTGWGL